MRAHADPSRPVASPEPLRVYTLGRYVLEWAHRSVSGTARSHRRPLELLALLIAEGAHEVPVVRLCEALWPDADGDRATRAFTSALHRLRALIGHGMVTLRDGRLSLAARHCWVDALAFAESADDSQAANVERLRAAADLYEGQFLEDAAEHAAVLATRERLHARYLSCVERLGALLRSRGRPEAAVAPLKRALSIDPVADGVARELMQCLRGCGDHARAEGVYEALRRAIEARGLGPPDAETATLRATIAAEREQEVRPADVPSVGVLPFRWLGPGRANQWMAGAFTENLVNRLARVPGLALVQGVLPPAGEPPARLRSLVGAAGEARFSLTGSVQSVSRQVRVTAELMETIPGTVRWSQRYDRVLDDVFAVQDEIVDSLLTALQVQLTEGEQARTFWRDTTADLRAWELAVRGLEAFRRRTPETNREAQRLWSEALELDPDYVAALIPLGWTYITVVQFPRDANPGEALNRAESLALRALRRDPHSGPARTLLAYVFIHRDRHDEALPLLREAAELHPGGADTTLIVGSGLCLCGLHEEGLGLMRRAMRLTPAYPEWYLAPLGRCLYLCGQLRPALQAVQAGPVVRSMLAARLIAVACHVALGETEAARAGVRAIIEAEPDFVLRTWLKRVLPLREATELERLAHALRSAGCP